MAEVAAGGAREAPLDELMLAMDVVDTLRHRELVIAREMGVAERDADLLQRLRDIYAAQGIEVPDRILREGVEAMRRSRFVYEPPPPGLGAALARLYVARRRWAPVLGIVLLVGAGLALAAYVFAA